MFKSILPNVLSGITVTAIVGGLMLWLGHNILQENQNRLEASVSTHINEAESMLETIDKKMDCWYYEQLYLSNIHALHSHNSDGTEKHPDIQRPAMNCAQIR